MPERHRSLSTRMEGDHLNADLLDGLSSSAFLPAGGKAADADLLDGLSSSAFLPAGAQAADADKLDGLDSSALPYWKLGGNFGTAPGPLGELGTNFIGTLDGQALELGVSGFRALRIEPRGSSPNMFGGSSGNGNSAANGAFGLTILVEAAKHSTMSTKRPTTSAPSPAGGTTSPATRTPIPQTRRTRPIAGGTGNQAAGAGSTVGGGNFQRGPWPRRDGAGRQSERSRRRLQLRRRPAGERAT